VARDEAYLLAKYYLDPSNRLATIHQRYRHTDRTGQTTVRQHRANCFTNGRPKIVGIRQHSDLDLNSVISLPLTYLECSSCNSHAVSHKQQQQLGYCCKWTFIGELLPLFLITRKLACLLVHVCYIHTLFERLYWPKL